MKEHERLLDEAQRFCDLDTGEVLERIPEELMSKLRAANLARGVPGKRNERTETYATWFVFLSKGIRERFLEQWREAKRQQKRYRTARRKDRYQNAVAGESKGPRSRGLAQFRQRRQSAK